jgi:hypothetical protein
MSDQTPNNQFAQELVKLLKQFQAGGDRAPISDAYEWDKQTELLDPLERDLVRELAHFADLWKHFQEHGNKLGPEIVDAISRVHELPLPLRTLRLREINQMLMERIGDAGADSQLRH